MHTLAIDPGLSGCGAALFDGPALTWATYVANHVGSSVNELSRACAMGKRILADVPFDPRMPHALVCEFPQIYTHRESGDNNDLLPLAAVLGSFATVFQPAELRVVRPHEWKGSIRKEEMTRRIIARVTPHEATRVLLPTAKSLQHNVWDAVGIGLFHLNRLERKRVIAR